MTTTLSTRSPKAVMVDPRDAEAVKRPGAYYFLRREGVTVGMGHSCPCGCGQRYMIFFRGRGPNPKTHPEWDVVREGDKLTLLPFIGILPMVDGKYHWYGFLRNGYFMEGGT